MIIVLLIIVLLIALFFIFNSIIWLHGKKIVNINDIIIQYTIYTNFIFVIALLLFLLYIYFYNLKIIIV
jgi:hypothetical protein